MASGARAGLAPPEPRWLHPGERLDLALVDRELAAADADPFNRHVELVHQRHEQVGIRGIAAILQMPEWMVLLERPVPYMIVMWSKSEPSPSAVALSFAR